MWMGIDPGKAGGVALVSDDGCFLAGLRMPMVKVGNRDVFDPKKATAWLIAHAAGRELSGVTLEQVSAMPRQGVTSSFNFGRHAGAVEAWAMSFACPVVVRVPPSQWKGKLGLSSDKVDSIAKAKQVFGPLSYWKVKANDGIAEAALLALYFRS
jgi:crossover junction endodeoxyribonuclease RuvC